MQLRLHGDGRDTLLLEWRPDLDDLATLRAALLFAEAPALYAHTPGAPALAPFCAGAAPPIAPVSAPLADVAGSLQAAARALIDHGLSPEVLDGWASRWRRAVAAEESAGRAERAGDLALAGAIVGGDAAALTALAPLKSEWLSQHLDALWSLLFLAMHDRDDDEGEPLEDTAAGVARTTAAHYPAHLRLATRDRPLLPTLEARIWSTYGGEHADVGLHASAALGSVMERLLTLQPEAAGHLRCLAWGPGAADLLVGQAIDLAGRAIGRATVGKVEIFCIEDGPESRPRRETLARADEQLAGAGRDQLEIRYLPSLAAARELLQAQRSRRGGRTPRGRVRAHPEGPSCRSSRPSSILRPRRARRCSSRGPGCARAARGECCSARPL